jgi:hypothetical protein
MPPSPSAQSPWAGPDGKFDILSHFISLKFCHLAGQGVPSSPLLVNEPTAVAENGVSMVLPWSWPAKKHHF